MQAVARCHIDLDRKFVFKEIFYARKIDQRKLSSLVIIDKNVDIAIWLCFVSRNRTKKI